MDPIQLDLTRYAEADDRLAHGRALDALAREWRVVLRRCSYSASPEELEDQLQQCLLDLGVKDERGRVRARCKVADGNLPRYRRTVLRNWLRDRWRKRNRRSHVERAIAEGLSPAAEKTQWRERGEANDLSLHVVEVAPAARSAEVEDIGELLDQRKAVLDALHTVPVRGRVLVLLALGGDPLHHAEALAAQIGDSPSAVVRRMRAALRAPHDQRHDYLNGAMVEVVYPGGHLERNRESARKALERAIRDLTRVVNR